MTRRLIANVCVEETWYGPAHGNATDVPDDVAAQVTNPAAWAEALEPPDDEAARAEDERLAMERIADEDATPLDEPAEPGPATAEPKAKPAARRK